MANHPGRAPRAPMVGAKADLKPLGRVIRMLFQDYPAMLIAVMACIIISAVVGILPAIYIETVCLRGCRSCPSVISTRTAAATS